MKTRRSLLRACAAALVTLASLPAHAVLLDRGPGDPTLLFPQWYRDLNGLALKECLSQSPSPNGVAGTMCFPLNPDPAGFAGNVGPEIFYNDLNVNLAKAGTGGGGFSLRYIAALEATYLPGPTPIHGQEIVFGRIRITIATQIAGTYKVTHPFGVEIFKVAPADLGPRAVFFTSDIPLGITGNFDLALQSRIGPFVQWDFVDPGLTLNVTSPTGVTEQFVGDPAFNHTYTGSPFGTNFVRVDGPVGSNLDGVGNDFIQSPLGNVVGQKWTAPIPTPLTISKSYYTRNATTIGINVAAKSAPGSQMILTGAGMPSVQMKGDALGNFFAHVEMPATAVPPAAVTVTNTTSVPANGVSQALVDRVNITTSTFDSLTKQLTVNAVSSDTLAPGPILAVDGPLGGLMTAGAYSTVVPAGTLPPLNISISSSAGGLDTDDVLVLPGLTDAVLPQPTVVSSVWTTNENTAILLPLGAAPQLSILAPATFGSLVIITPPGHGSVAVGAAGAVTYTPALNFFSGGAVPPDSFQYVVIDSTGAVSNAGTVTVNVPFFAAAPVAVGDDFAIVRNTVTPLAGRAVNVVANDVAASGTTINAASVLISTPPLHGTAVANANGTVTYTPALNYIGADSYAYTVANTAGTRSAPATVNIVVEGTVETLTATRSDFTVSKNQWNIVASTNWFGPTLTHTTVTCWVGKGTGGTAGPLIGTAPIDTAGKFALVPPPLTTPAPDATNIFTCQTSNSLAPAGTTTAASGVLYGVVTRR
ncbi:MAG TPA: Ig-like domain-containing protein [Anaeromyxobacteraceae bacterium]|nr:Ig-like domain-containing protein [Anaeromyxobacteraceae bacterium]